ERIVAQRAARRSVEGKQHPVPAREVRSRRLSKTPTGEFTAEEVWFSKSMENHRGGVILHDGALFGANGGNGGGYLACLDFKTGEVLWNEADRDKRRVTKGSVAFAEDRKSVV